MSSTEGKTWIRDRVHALGADGPLSVLDIGPGVGTYAKLLAGPAVSRLTGDVVIIGDVAEHMSEADALALWAKCCSVAQRAVYLSIPFVHYPQHEIEGNPHEIHVDEDWNHERVLSSFAGIGDWEKGTEVGVYERTIHLASSVPS